MNARDILIRLCAFCSAAVCAAQTVWFCPTVPAQWNNFEGSADYLDLFQPGAPWTAAASHVRIFKMYTQMFLSSVPGSLSDGQLQQIFSYLNSHQIALAVEFGPLTPSAPPGCGMNTEGFGGQTAPELASRIRRLGGNLQYIAMDEPFFFGSLYTGANACNWTPERVATEALQTIAQIRTVFPDVIVGDIEPVPATVYSKNWLNQYSAWMDAWNTAAGAPFAFFHFDVNWTVDWQPQVESLRQQLAQRHIPFGMIYNGWQSDSTDATWINDAESHYVSWEAEGFAIPDQVIFQSWYPYPQHLLPESDPTAFTYLIDSYFRERTRLSLAVASAQVSGTLVDSLGAPIASAPIALTAQAVSGPGAVASYVLSGVVPSAVTQAVIQTCVNECGDVGVADLNIYSFQYASSVAQTSFNFVNGLNGWSVDGNGNAIVQPASDTNGASIHISATSDQQTFVNSAPLIAVPGSNVTVTIQARVSPSSEGSGYFALVFLNAGGTEISRATLAFASPVVPVGTALTNNEGTYTLSLPEVNQPGTQLLAAYGGNSSLWPAFANAPLGAIPAVPSNGIVNAADFKFEPLAPGAWFSIFGQNLGGAAQWTDANTFTLGDASVSVCGVPAAISYNSGPVVTNGTTGWQLNALTPDAVAGQTACAVVVTVGGQSSEPVAVTIASGIIELFSFATSAGSLPIITHADYSLVGPGSAGLVPAQPGEEVIAWGTGDCSTPSVLAGGIAATVLFSGRVEPALCQLNILVPGNASGQEQLSISTSPNAYTLSAALE